MSTDTTAVTRADLHALIDALPAANLKEALRLVAAPFKDDPALLAAILAPVDDEPFTDEEREAVEAAREAYRRGEWVSSEDVPHEIGW